MPIEEKSKFLTERFILFHHERRPAEMGAIKMTAFLRHLTTAAMA